SSSAVSTFTFLLNPKLISGLPSSLTVNDGTRLLNNVLLVCSSFWVEVLMERAIPLARTLTKLDSSSVGQRSTYAARASFLGSLEITLWTREVFPKRRSEKTKSFSLLRIALKRSACSASLLQKA